MEVLIIIISAVLGYLLYKEKKESKTIVVEYEKQLRKAETKVEYYKPIVATLKS